MWDCPFWLMSVLHFLVSQTGLSLNATPFTFFGICFLDSIFLEAVLFLMVLGVGVQGQQQLLKGMIIGR